MKVCVILILTAVLLSNSTVRAQDTATVASASAAIRIPPSWKDHKLASVLGFMMPSMGQFYVGRTGKGTVIFASALGGAIYAGTSSCTHRDFANECDERTLHSEGYILTGVAWLWGWLSASNDASQHNLQILKWAQSGQYGIYDAGGNGLGFRIAVTP